MGGVADNASDKATEAPEGRHGPNRFRNGLRDMALSMVVLGVIVLAFAALTRGCAFSPGGPSDNGVSAPPVDVSAELRAAAGQVRFPLRQPGVPAGWRASSASVDPLGANGADHAVRIGWVTAGGRYVQLSQSDANPADLAGLAAGTTVAPTGSTVVAGTTWTTYPGVRSELAWVADLGPVRMLVTGNADDAEFRALASAAVSGTRVTGTG